MDSISAIRRPWFVEEDDGLASLADLEAGFSDNNHPFLSRSLCHGRRGSMRNLLPSYSVSSPRSARFYDSRLLEDNQQPHFLESCFLCNKPLGHNSDIFMYRGDTPFCSEECRQEQIEMDEAKEKNWNLSSTVKVLRKKDPKKTISPTNAQKYPSRAGTVAVA